MSREIAWLASQQVGGVLADLIGVSAAYRVARVSVVFQLEYCSEDYYRFM